MMPPLPNYEEKKETPSQQEGSLFSMSTHLPKKERGGLLGKSLELFLRHSLVRLLQFLAILVVVGIPLFLVFARVHGLGKGVCHRVEKALSGSFYDAKIHRLFFSISEGLIAEDLRLLEHTPSKRLLFQAHRVTIFPNLAALSTGVIEIDSFQLHRTTIDVPLGQGEEPRLRLDHVEAKVICPPGQLTVSDAQFDLCGIHGHIRGNFLNPKTFSPRPVSTNGPGKIAETIDRIQRELQRVQWKGVAPVLEIEASGDLTHTESLRVDHIGFHAGSCSYGSWNLIGVTADMEYSNFQLKVHQISIEDQVGELHLSGGADFKNNQATVSFSGACDVGAIASMLFPKSTLLDCTWIDTPHLEGQGSVSWKGGAPLFQCETHLDAGRFTYQGIDMESLSAGCAFQGDRFLMRNLKLVGAPGTLEADLMLAPQDCRARLNASLLPQQLESLATGPLKNFLQLLNFKDPCKLELELQGPQLDPFLLEGSGKLELGASSMRGSWINSLTSTFGLKEGVIGFQNIFLKIGEGTASGECLYNMKEKELLFPGVKGNADPITIMTWIDPHIAETLKEYRFHQPPDVKVNGSIGLKDPQKNDFHIQVNAPQGLDYTLLKHNLSFKNATGNVSIKNQELQVRLPHAAIFGGEVGLNVDVSIVPGDGRYEADVTLDGVDLKSVTKLYFDYDTSQGKLSGNYHFAAVATDDHSMQGEGSLLIKDGNVLAMPILGPLSILMNDIYPGLGYQSARRATADFAIKNATINTKNISIESAEFSMIGSGSIYYLEDRMNMQMRLNLKGLPGLVLFPVSKLFEYAATGSIKNANWHPKFVTLPKLPYSR